MLTEIYIEALLADEDLADQVWELWDGAVITDGVAALAWCIVAVEGTPEEFPKCRQSTSH